MSDPVTIEYTPFIEHRVRGGETLASLAKQHGMTWQDLTMFNFGTAVPKEVNRFLHEITGCNKRTRDGWNYIFTDKDVPGIIYIPKPSEPLTLPTGNRHRILVKRPILFSQVEVETVDDLGVRVGDVDLILQSLEGLPDVSLHSDKSGYGKAEKVRAGKYKVLLASGKPALMLPETPSSPGAGAGGDDNSLVEAQIDTRNHERAITTVVVARTETADQRAQRKLLTAIHGRAGQTATLEGRGDETAGATLRSAYYAIDNLVLAAGWTSDNQVNYKELAATVLHGFLHDYHPTALARGYHVLVLTPQTRVLLLVGSDGTVEKHFELAEGVTTKGLLGAYAMFENRAGTTFVDMTTKSTVVAVPGHENGVDVEQIVSDPEGLLKAMDKHAHEVEILYYCPTPGQLITLALLGGTGRLEDYVTDADVNRSIHQRNLAVCHSLQVAYDAYVRSYIEKVQKTANESELRKLGPPKTPFEMPTPAGATDDQAMELLRAVSTTEFDAWKAIAEQLDHFAKRMSQGFPFLRIKPKYVATPKVYNKIKNFLRPGLPDVSEKLPVEMEFEMNIDIQIVDGKFEVITKGDALIKGKVKLDSVVNAVTKNGVPVEIAYKRSLGNPDKNVVSVKISKFQLEMDTVGKTKVSLEAVPGVWIDSEMNADAGIFGAGVTLKGKDLAAKLRGRGAFFEKWAGLLDGVEVQFQVGLVGTREETILAVVSNAPGFFERRSLKELFDPKTQWVDLTLDEHQSLVNLGWYAEVWNGKYHAEYKDKLPESVHQSRYELSDTAKVAIVHLGFYAYEDYGKMWKKSVSEFSDYVY
jgi:hypothetical protein